MDYLLAWIVHQQRRTDGGMETKHMETYVRDLVESARRIWKRSGTVKKVPSDWHTLLAMCSD